jgi:hypothetical protein
MAWIKISEDLYSNDTSPHLLIKQPDGKFIVKKSNYDTDLELSLEDIIVNPIIPSGTFEDGTESQPSITSKNYLDTGIFWDSEGLNFSTDGKTKFVIKNNGQLQNTFESTVGTDYNDTLSNGYLCRAWVNFDGTGTFTPNPSTSKIRASGNVSSITDNGIGNYTINFTISMIDTNYSFLGNATDIPSNLIPTVNPDLITSFTVNSIIITVYSYAGNFMDSPCINIGIFR